MKTTKINHSEILSGLKAEHINMKDQLDSARQEWMNNRHGKEGWDLYQVYHNCREQVKRLEGEIDFHSIMLQDKKYATEWLYSDAHAYEILEEKNARMILVRQLKAAIKPEAQKRLQESFVSGGFCGNFDNSLQEWNFEICESNPVITIRKHKDGRWYANGSRRFSICAEPYEHHDYNF